MTQHERLKSIEKINEERVQLVGLKSQASHQRMSPKLLKNDII
jgi:hypothetical protein